MNSHNFQTRLQLDEYLKCIRSLKVGDRVEYYCNPNSCPTPMRWSSVPTQTTRFAEVILTGDNLLVCKPSYFFSSYVQGTNFYNSSHVNGAKVIIASHWNYLDSLSSASPPLRYSLSQAHKDNFESFKKITDGLLVKSVIKTKWLNGLSRL